jgi:hypothetical protein
VVTQGFIDCRNRFFTLPHPTRYNPLHPHSTFSGRLAEFCLVEGFPRLYVNKRFGLDSMIMFHSSVLNFCPYLGRIRIRKEKAQVLTRHFACWHWGTSQNTSVRIAGIRAGIRPRDFWMWSMITPVVPRSLPHIIMIPISLMSEDSVMTRIHRAGKRLYFGWRIRFDDSLLGRNMVQFWQPEIIVPNILKEQRYQTGHVLRS